MARIDINRKRIPYKPKPEILKNSTEVAFEMVKYMQEQNKLPEDKKPFVPLSLEDFKYRRATP